MASTILEIAQQVADESGFTIDSAVVGSTDQTTKQILAIANRLAREITDAFAWTHLQKEAQITLADGTSTYQLPADINYAFHETVWNRNEEWPIYGPYSPQDRQYLRSGIINRYPYQRYTFRGLTNTQFELDPTPTSTDTGSIVVFEYQSARGVRPRTWEQGQAVAVGDYTFYNGNYYQASSAGSTGATPPTHTSGSVSDGSVDWDFYDGVYYKFLADTDVPNVDENVFSQGLLERFSERHGVAVQPRYEVLLQREAEKQTPGKYVDMLARPRTRYPNAPGTEWAT